MASEMGPTRAEERRVSNRVVLIRLVTIRARQGQRHCPRGTWRESLMAPTKSAE